jgi:ribosomal protein L11 methyltransferase
LTLPAPVDAYRVVVSAAEEDGAVAALWEAGTLGLQVVGEGERIALVAYFERAATTLAALRARLAGAEVQPAAVPEVDWVARFREAFSAFDVAGFRVVPAWEAPAALPPDVLVVDPGRAFGTGTHETTQLCLRAVAELAPRGLRRVLDLGCGTGLLGIAAARLGAGLVVALDHDPEAVAAARRHAALNRVALALVRGDGGGALRPGSFDLVLANLAAAVLVERRQEVAALVAPGGAAVLSGLLAEERHELAEAFGRYGRVEARVDGEWAALLLRRDAA